jgi:hypothetical protein
MTEQIHVQQQQRYRVVMVHPRTYLILVQRSENKLLVPRISVLKGIRIVAQIQKTIENLWHSKSVILDFLPRNELVEPTVLVEIRSLAKPGDLSAVDLDQIPETEINTEERTAIREILFGSSGKRSPFSRVGWLDEAMSWIGAILDGKVRLTGGFEQHNAGGSFALMKFHTQCGPAYWLKATGDPNRHELPVTTMLAEICPQYLPALITTRRDWNAWIMEDAGIPIQQASSAEEIERTIISMAALQKLTLPRTELLCSAGVTDQRTHILIRRIPELMSFLAEAMARQTSTRVPRIESARLQELEIVLRDACVAMEDLGIPTTVIHNDINHGNILIRSGKCVFTDWCEACIGNPFLTLQHLLVLFSSRHDYHATVRYFLQVYKSCWLDSLKEWQINRAFTFMPLLAIYSYLYGRGNWLNSERRFDPHFLSYARSLARYMDSAAQQLIAEEALCQ